MIWHQRLDQGSKLKSRIQQNTLHKITISRNLISLSFPEAYQIAEWIQEILVKPLCENFIIISFPEMLSYDVTFSRTPIDLFSWPSRLLDTWISSVDILWKLFFPRYFIIGLCFQKLNWLLILRAYQIAGGFRLVAGCCRWFQLVVGGLLF